MVVLALMVAIARAAPAPATGASTLTTDAADPNKEAHLKKGATLMTQDPSAEHGALPDLPAHP